MSDKELKELKRRLTKLFIEARITEEEYLEKYERIVKKKIRSEK